MTDRQPYNPLAKQNLGVSVADALLALDVEPLSPEEAFEGAGIYAIYYLGSLPLYAPLSSLPPDEEAPPIYVGKAVPAGARLGAFDLERPPGNALYNRLTEHAESIELVRDLELSDFKCRCLAVDDIWIPLGEALLIQRFQPVWNCVTTGFGNHDPGSGRHGTAKSDWDVLHPGRTRKWKSKLRGKANPLAEIEERVREHFDT